MIAYPEPSIEADLVAESLDSIAYAYLELVNGISSLDLDPEVLANVPSWAPIVAVDVANANAYADQAVA